MTERPNIQTVRERWDDLYRQSAWADVGFWDLFGLMGDLIKVLDSEGAE